MTFTHSHDLGSLGDGKLVFQNAVGHLNPCLFLLVQRYIPHGDDIFAEQLAGDRIVEHQQALSRTSAHLVRDGGPGLGLAAAGPTQCRLQVEKLGQQGLWAP